MANRQHGRGRPPRSGRPPSGRPAAPSRRPLGEDGVPAVVEPEVRRWPHPLEDGSLPPASAPEPALHYIRCALSYQNQLLADIKVLLEQMAPAAAPEAGPEEPGEDPPKL